MAECEKHVLKESDLALTIFSSLDQALYGDGRRQQLGAGAGAGIQTAAMSRPTPCDSPIIAQPEGEASEDKTARKH